MECMLQDICTHIVIEDKYLQPENRFTVTPVKELNATAYYVLNTVKFQRTQLLRVQDLSHVFTKVCNTYRFNSLDSFPVKLR